MSDTQLNITPKTKIGELLEAYPELEEQLVAIAPAFKKLRNPVLRRTVARVTSLSQAAKVGSMSVGKLVSQLRKAVGQSELQTPNERSSDNSCHHESQPDWLDKTKISDKLDARPMIEDGQEPIGRVFWVLDKLSDSKILELITPFQPAPLIDKAMAKGYHVWTTTVSASEHRTYFIRKQSGASSNLESKSRDIQPPCQSTPKRFDV